MRKQWRNSGAKTNKSMSGHIKSSSGDSRCRYLRTSFWFQPENKFWDSPMYSQASKDFFESRLSEWARREKYLPNLQTGME